MKCYAHEKPPHEQLPVLLQLAREFAVCDRWFSSIPGPTWPNRFFMHAASSAGIDASPSGFDSAMAELFNGYSFHNGTIFHRLESHQLKWAVFQGDSFPVTGALAGLNDDYFFGFDKFEAAVNNPEYPFAYTFIEPNYGNDLPLSPRISLAETRNIRKMMSRGARSSLNRSTRLSEILPNGPRVYYLSPTMSMADSSMFHHLQPGDGLYYGDFGTSLSGDRLYLLVGKHGFDFTQLGP
jgi:hypothetical protein